MKTKLSPLLAIIGALTIMGLAPGCDHPHADGTLQLSWTIEGAMNAGDCTTTGATELHVVILNSGGTIEATSNTPCNAFQTSFSLRPDDYTATGTFLGANGQPISPNKVIPAFTILSEQVVVRTIDFPFTDLLPL